MAEDSVLSDPSRRLSRGRGPGRREMGLIKHVHILRVRETRFLAVGGRSYTQRTAETSKLHRGDFMLEVSVRTHGF